MLHRTVAAHLERFLAHARRQGRTVPRFVERELRAFLDCGIPAHGFLRVRCAVCRRERVVPFSCKGRGPCPSCGGRRTADTAAHLVDRVLPTAPVRQWVLSLPWSLRYRMAYDAGLTSAILRELVRAVFGSLRRAARKRRLRGRARCGAVTFVQRFGGALNINVHFHTLALDGVYLDDGQQFHLHPLPPPDDAEVERVTRRIAVRIERVLAQRGLGPDADPREADPTAREQPLLSALAGASVRGRIATGRRAGQRVLRFGDQVDPEEIAANDAARLPPRCAAIDGVSLHANVAVPARDRDRLERLCRYVARPPLAGERLTLLPDGRLAYALKRRWRDGTRFVVFEPLELVEKLATLVPPPRFNLVRYHGVLAPAARGRAEVIPRAPTGAKRPDLVCAHAAGRATGDTRAGKRAARPPSKAASGKAASTAATGRGARTDTADATGAPQARPAARPRRYSWPELMRRVFAVDVLQCPDCGSAMRILAAIHPPKTTRVILDCLGLPSRPPPQAPAAAEPPEPDLFADLPPDDLPFEP